VHSSDSNGCHNAPPPAGKSGDVDGNGDVVDKAPPEMGTMLLARLRMYVVASWFGDDDGSTPAVIA
jgi:hypothetical protein